ncbi:hypothetical protein DL96DRAFT_1593826 [Flagelloscypha sp. PMI_526]|nr:hypothetical protein DL96DRAFT_1593826 [Flagelloscypha sp. PMI_526]
MDTSKERDKEYQRLKAQHEKLKRKALLASSGNTTVVDTLASFHPQRSQPRTESANSPANPRPRPFAPWNATNSSSPFEAQGGFDSHSTRIQMPPRAVPFHVSSSGNSNLVSQFSHNSPAFSQQNHPRGPPQRHSNPSPRSINLADTSDSANEVENLLVHSATRKSSTSRRPGTTTDAGWVTAPQSAQRTFGQRFRPAAVR